MQKRERYNSTWYFTKVQEGLIRDWVAYKDLTVGHKYKSDHIFDTLFNVMKSDDNFNNFIAGKIDK